VQTRAVLLDIPHYLSSHNRPPLDPVSYPSSTTIDLPLIQSALGFFNLAPRAGDVLLVRTGFEDALSADKVRLRAGEDTHLVGKWAGVQANRDTLEWIWKTGFVAVGSDNPTFEEWCESSGHPRVYRTRLTGRLRTTRHVLPSDTAGRYGHHDRRAVAAKRGRGGMSAAESVGFLLQQLSAHA